MQRRSRILLIAVLLLLGGVALLLANRHKSAPIALPSAQPRAGALPVMWPAPAFSLGDQNGAVVDNNTLKGRIWIADFIFTSCGNVCPRMTAKRVELQKELADPRISFLSFSVDPERDNAQTRKAYAAKHGVDESRWHFVSPPNRDAALKLAVAMKIAGKPREHDNPLLHADRFLLIDATGRVRGIYHLDDAAAMSRLAGEARTLANELPPVKSPTAK
jgi:protein SCO1